MPTAVDAHDEVDGAVVVVPLDENPGAYLNPSDALIDFVEQAKKSVRQPKLR